MHDLKFAFRQLLKNPGFTAVAVLTLALGIGANTAIFSFVNSILLRPLPYQDPERLVMVFENAPVNGWFKNRVGAPVLAEWRRQSTVFEGLAARGWDNFILTGNGQPENLSGSRLSANTFSLLGIKPILGRSFDSEEEIYGKHHVALLSYELWQRRFGGDPKIVGRPITLNAEPHEVIGVMPPQTFFPEPDTQIWAPLAFSPGELRQRHAHNYMVYGKLKAGVRLKQAGEEMNVIARRMAEADEQNKDWGAEVYPLREIVVGDSPRLLFVLLGAVGMVLLIACANIANLLLARSTARSHEFAIRAALGAGRGSIIRQLLIESLVLALLGGAGGVALAFFGLETLFRVSPPDLPRVWEGISVDGTTLCFTILITVLTGVLFGLTPAVQASSPAIAYQLNESPRGGAGRQRQRLRSALVISEVALSMMLLIGAGLLIRSFSHLLSEPIGFRPEHLVTMDVSLPAKKYPAQADRVRFYDQFLARVQVLPGVHAAAVVNGLPLSGNRNYLSVSIPGAPAPAPGETVAAGYAQVSPGYFHAMNIPLLRGRDFTEQDRANTLPAVIVDESFARLFKLGTNVLGRRINIGDGTDNVEIIGLVKDIKRTGMAEPPRGEMYRTYKQMSWGGMSLVLRTRRDPGEMARTIRAALDAIDKDQPIENVRTMTQLVSASVAQRRLSVELLGGFAAVAMLLAGIGLYGVLAYNVAQRRREIGIRIALGAQMGDVLRLVVGQGIRLVVIGAAVGLAAALGLSRVLSSLLYEVKPSDPATLVGVTLLLAVVALLACWLPARRAAKVTPMEALRYE